jgi:hypothetical protein
MRAGLIIFGMTLAAVVFLWIASLQARLSSSQLRNEFLEREAAVLQLQVESNARALRLEARRAENWKERSETLQQSIETILEGVAPDALLDPSLVDLLDGLRR